MIKQTYLLAFIFVLVSTSHAQIDPTKIDIVRDKFGVPHIFGKTDPDVAYGLAWAHAEDDFKTIQQSLLAAKEGLDTTAATTKADLSALQTKYADLVKSYKGLEEQIADL